MRSGWGERVGAETGGGGGADPPDVTVGSSGGMRPICRWRAVWQGGVPINLVGVVDLILDYYDAVTSGLPTIAGQFGATYWIPTIYVPLLMITHVVAFCLLPGPEPKAVRVLVGKAAAA
jgi:hypothetical protein